MFAFDLDYTQAAKMPLYDATTRHEMQFEDYQPRAFGIIRELFGIPHAQYRASFEQMVSTAKLTEGRSGAFVFHSSDGQYLVKSMTEKERRFLLSILSPYIQYLKWNHQHTLLPKFYGCHALTMYGQTFHFVVMANIFAPANRAIHRRYDVKGSWVNRAAPPAALGQTYMCGNCGQEYVHGHDRSCSKSIDGHTRNITYCDNDLKQKLRIPPTGSQALWKQLVRDTQFLAGLGIMDYSLFSCARHGRISA